MTRPRDNQRQRVYDAERYDGKQFKTTDECQAYVDSILASAWCQNRWGKRSIEVRPGHGHRRATARGRIIQLPIWARNEGTILHEMAHCLMPGSYAAHGPEFVAVLLTLTKHKRGEKVYDDQYFRFATGGVQVNWAAVPKPGTHKAITKTEVAARKRANESRPLSTNESREAAALIRRAVKAGTFGAVGRKPRTQALAVARALEA